MSHTVVIGCEVHVQLLTETKAFCSCPNAFGGEPNSRVCPVCLGLPGSMPVANRAMIDHAIIAGLALHSEIAALTKFDRKNYVYPDLPKGYQISQFDMPICMGGFLDLPDNEGGRRVGIIRIHLEEDAGKNIHPEGEHDFSYVDHNRCGTPLLEIVSEPDLRSPEEAVAFVQGLREIMRYLGVSDCNMEEASMRCDANINLWIHENGEKKATPIAEVKNMNSFRSIKAALTYEIERQLGEWDEQHKTLQEEGKTTRGWDEARSVTVLQRSKEEASDYRYFPEPDLKPVAIPMEYVDVLKTRVGELPEEKRKRFVAEYGITVEDASKLSSSKDLCDYFEATAEGAKEPRRIANWILGDVRKVLNAKGIEIGSLPVTPASMRGLLDLVDEGKISGKIAKEVFAEMAESGLEPGEIVEKRGLVQITDSSALVAVVDKVLSNNTSSVEDFRSGKEKALKFLMGQIMKETKGKANPQLASALLEEKLKE